MPLIPSFQKLAIKELIKKELVLNQ